MSKPSILRRREQAKRKRQLRQLLNLVGCALIAVAMVIVLLSL